MPNKKHNTIPLGDGKFVLAWDIDCKDCREGRKCNQPYRELTENEIPILELPNKKDHWEEIEEKVNQLLREIYCDGTYRICDFSAKKIILEIIEKALVAKDQEKRQAKEEVVGKVERALEGTIDDTLENQAIFHRIKSKILQTLK